MISSESHYPGAPCDTGEECLWDISQMSLQQHRKILALPVQCLLLENSSPKMLTSSHEQKQSRDGVYCDAESTGEINAPLSSHDPSSLRFKSGTV